MRRSTDKHKYMQHALSRKSTGFGMHAPKRSLPCSALHGRLRCVRAIESFVYLRIIISNCTRLCERTGHCASVAWRPAKVSRVCLGECAGIHGFFEFHYSPFMPLDWPCAQILVPLRLFVYAHHAPAEGPARRCALKQVSDTRLCTYSMPLGVALNFIRPSSLY